MTIEERLTRLENFMGDIDRITSLYANTVQEICDKYLNLLYIEEPDTNHKNVLVINGFLGEIDIDKLPRNVIFNVRASHNFAFEGDVEASKIKFARDGKSVEIPLKKYSDEHQDNLEFLQPDDYIAGIVYNIYINSQGIAVIASNDTGVMALQEVTQLGNEIEALNKKFAELGASQSVADITANNAIIDSLTVSKDLKLTNPIVLPTGTNCSTPVADNNTVPRSYVDATIDAKIKEYHRTFHVFNVGEPNASELAEGAIYYKYE